MLFESNECDMVKNVLNNSIRKINDLNKNMNNNDFIKDLNEPLNNLICDLYKEIFTFTINSINNNTKNNRNIINFNPENNLFSISVITNAVNEGSKRIFSLGTPNYDIKISLTNFKKLIIDSILFFMIKFNQDKDRRVWFYDFNNYSVISDDFILQRYYLILIPLMINYFLEIPGMSIKFTELGNQYDLYNYQEKGGRKVYKTKKSRNHNRSKTKRRFLFNPNNPKKSFDVYIDKNPKDTIHIKYTTLEDVKNTIDKLEKLYKNKKYTHKRIWQVGMIMMVRLEVIKNKKPEQYELSKKYFEFLGDRTKLDNKERYKSIFIY